MSKIVPAYKADDDTYVNNYWPIFPWYLISIGSLKKIIKKGKLLLRIWMYSLHQSMISEKHTPLDMQFLISWTCHTDKHGQGIILMWCFIDLKKKVFDTVDHILLPELEYYGFCGVTSMWLTTYLQGQTQKTLHVSSKIDIRWCASRLSSRSCTLTFICEWSSNLRQV